MMSELVSTDVAACENAATLLRRFFLSALPTERSPAPRGRIRHAKLAVAPYAGSSPAQHGASPAQHGASFAGVGVPAPLVAALAAPGITAPFPIQAATLPDA